MKNLFKITLTLFITLIIVLGFAMPVNPVGNWYQQFMPSIGSQQLNDVIFLDSLTGYAVTSRNVNPDTASILKTSNGGDNWQVVFSQNSRRFSKVKFINSNTGFVCGGTGTGTPYLYKTTNAGANWLVINSSGCTFWNDIYALNNDTIWIVDNDGVCGSVNYTTNGGINWTVQFTSFGNNPDRIYMYNRNFGFISHNNASMYRTTNGGLNWVLVTGQDGFRDIYFTDNLTGWKANGTIKKTTDGGLNWAQQVIPSGGIISGAAIWDIHVINKDTIWGVGGSVEYPNLQSRGIIYRTVNGGDNWLFQIPDTSINLYYYSFIQFVNPRIGWAYRIGPNGIHTTNGGDPVWLTDIKQISSEVPVEFRLYQNYPNPFNPKTIIKYQIINNRSGVNLAVFDVTGRHIVDLVNRQQNVGTYQVDFVGSKYASGVYFYRLTINSGKEVYNLTKTMILVK